MSVAKVTEISASSETSFEDAIQKGIDRADKTLDRVKGAWVNEMKVEVEVGAVDRDPPLRRIVETRNEVGERRLPRPGLPHEGDDLTNVDPERDVLQDERLVVGLIRLGLPKD